MGERRFHPNDFKKNDAPAPLVLSVYDRVHEDIMAKASPDLVNDSKAFALAIVCTLEDALTLAKNVAERL